MPPFPNLISESLLVTETLKYLKSTGGRAPAVRVVDRVMNIKRPEPVIARLLVQDLTERDSRLVLQGDHLELVEIDADGLEISSVDYVVFDLETTGAKAPPCRITEIGAYRVRKGVVAEEFHTLVNPQTPIPPFITSLTGISDDMVRSAPLFGDIANDLLEFIGDAVLVAHNARFDMGFLNYCLLYT
ncbi:MAG: exonuclease domain-containing protein, partial [Pyrinomonadaceae bacterium]|nr:exonuclease domain-containing protein [Pyrinomonadaceae bacterium]